MQPSTDQVSAAHDAWEDTVSEWKLRRISNHGMGSDMWLLESIGSSRYDAGTDYASTIAAHRFEGPNAERDAKFMLRDKCIRAVLSAALKATE